MAHESPKVAQLRKISLFAHLSEDALQKLSTITHEKEWSASDVLFHEGDSVANGLVLQQIKPRAAVFDYKGYRYEMPF